MLALLMHLKHALKHDKFWQHQVMKFDFYSRPDGYRKPIRRSHKVILFVYDSYYILMTGLEVLDTCVRNSLLS